MQLLYTKRIGALGRIVIPSDIRKTWGLAPGTLVGVYADNGKVVIVPVGCNERCFLCGEAANQQILNKPFCRDCVCTITKEGQV